MTSHPDIVVEKKSDSPDEDKRIHDSKLFLPTLKDFFCKHPLINPKTFLGDAAFDTVELYKSLLTGNTFGDNKYFSKAYIPLNARSGLENQDYTISEDGSAPKMSGYPLFIPEFVLCTNSSLFWFKIANELSNFAITYFLISLNKQTFEILLA